MSNTPKILGGSGSRHTFAFRERGGRSYNRRLVDLCLQREVGAPWKPYLECFDKWESWEMIFNAITSSLSLLNAVLDLFIPGYFTVFIGICRLTNVKKYVLTNVDRRFRLIFILG